MSTATYTYSMKVPLAHHGKETLRYGSSLEDTTSPHYQQLNEATREGLDRMVMQSDLRDIYHGVVVNGFQPDDQGDGVTVNFYVQVCQHWTQLISAQAIAACILPHVSSSKFHFKIHLCALAT